jgi:hypothetical protein
VHPDPAITVATATASILNDLMARASLSWRHGR